MSNKVNFGAILNQWEKSHRDSQTFDKDVQCEGLEVRKKKCNAKDTIDLHGLTRDEAWRTLNAFISNSQRRGLRKVFIIHGKGNHSEHGVSVLASLVRKFIEEDKRLGLSGYLDPAQGGSGVTWVEIR